MSSHKSTPRKSQPPRRKTDSASPRNNGSALSSPSPRRKQAFHGENGISRIGRDWQTWSELEIKVHNLPLDITLDDLWHIFASEGEITYMDIFSRGPNRNGISAKLRFEPPPRRPLWEMQPFLATLRGAESPLRLQIVLRNTIPQNWVFSTTHRDRRYPKVMKLQLRELKFGTLINHKVMAVENTLAAIPDKNDLRLNVFVHPPRLHLFFPMRPSPSNKLRTERHYRMDIDITNMKHAFHHSTDGKDMVLTFALPFPPRYYRRIEQAEFLSTFRKDSTTWTAQRNVWHRVTNVVEDHDEPLRYAVALHDDILDSEYMDIGNWLTFCLVFTGESDESQGVLQHLLTFLTDFNVEIEPGEDLSFRSDIQETVWNYLEHSPTMEHGDALALLAREVPHLPFDVRYQLEVCLSQRILNKHNIGAEFLQKLVDLGPIKARLHLEYLADQEKPLYEPMRLFDNPDAEFFAPNIRVPHYCALVRKATITPTRICFSTPAIEKSNRVIRKYNYAHDRFLRIQFVNEPENDRLKGEKDYVNDDDVWRRVLRTLFQGIRIGDRHYEFLAFGSSQLRQGGAYFFCPTEHLSCDDIRKWMGNFDHIKVIAKYAARLGQCFSTTREIRRVNEPHIQPIPDIEKNGYCFTDGVGMISKLLSTIVIEEMELDVFDEPSAFQFRMGGHKGVLVHWPQAKGMEVLVRQSQEKFTAGFNGLEVIKCAGFATATLNRQTIAILECLGVPIKAFMGLLNHQLRQYRDSVTDDNVCIDLLTRFVDENHTTLILAEMLKAGFKSGDIQEPFVLNVITLWRAWSLKLLKEKARILVEKSAFLLGCVDETGTLKGHSVDTEGSQSKDVSRLPEIFLQITDPKRNHKKRVITGVCIVGRNPSLHPGDIRVVHAVDNPELHHLKDVVVFPSTGDRPVPNMLSGGDLDGDDFFVIWEPSLIPSEWNFPPMNYSATGPAQLDRDVNVNDLCNFFVKYMKEDVLGLIAFAHVAHADEHGPKSEICLRLAELHSAAVDYAKTGEAVSYNHQQMNPRQWPHFMEKRGKSRKSTKALGVIYDKLAAQKIQFLPDWGHKFDKRILTRHETDLEMLKAARKIKAQYDTAARRMLTQLRLETEFELWTGFAMSRAVGESDYKRMETLGHEFDVLKQRFRELCYDAAGGNSPDKLDPFVTAMYKVTEEEVKIALYEHDRGPINEAGHIIQPRQLKAKSMPLISFPWIFHWVMIRIAVGGKFNHKKSLFSTARRGGTVLSLRGKSTSTAADDDNESSDRSEAVRDSCTSIHDDVQDGLLDQPQDQGLAHDDKDGDNSDSNTTKATYGLDREGVRRDTD